MTARRWLTIAQAADYAEVSPKTIRTKIAEGHLPGYQPKGLRGVRIDADDLEAWVVGPGRIPSAHLAGRQPARWRRRDPDYLDRKAAWHEEAARKLRAEAASLRQPGAMLAAYQAAVR
jgi:excisionase family DNA binding protein